MTAVVTLFFASYALSVAAAVCANPYETMSFAEAGGIATVSSCLFVAALPLVLGRISKLLTVPLVLWLGLLAAVKLFVNGVLNQGESTLGVEWVAILMNSSCTEIGEFCALFCWRSEVIVGALLLMMSIVGTIYELVKGDYFRPCVRVVAIGLLMMVPAIAVNLKGASTTDSLSALLFDTVIDINEGQGFALYREIGEVGRNENFEFVPRMSSPSNENPVVVFVIGESATRNHWGLYGYNRNTTPEMSSIADELLIFRKVTACSPYTSTSVKCILTDAVAEPGSHATIALPPLLKAAGYETALVSAQYHWGEFDGFDALMFATCGRRVFLSDVEGIGAYDDAAVIPHLDRIMSSSSGNPLALFVHLLGSHYDFSARYPRGFDPFAAAAADGPQEKLVSEYDNTIAYTDKVLGGIVDWLRKSAKLSAMIYLSDHGESLGGNYRDISDPDVRDIPMIVWTSERYRETAADAIATLQSMLESEIGSDNLFDYFCRLFFLDVPGHGDEN